MIYALDSNIISYLLKNDTEVKQQFQNSMDNNNLYVIPPIVYYEVKRWLKIRNATNQLQKFSDLYNNSVKNDMTLDIWEKAIELYVALRTTGKSADDADVFIAAFCIVNGYILITNNVNHFEFITELQVINWK